MPANWDFRRILRVHPEEERNCVGYAQSRGRRCLNPINKFDRPTASRMLDQMDRSAHLFDVIDDLEELASLLLCKGVHRKSQVPDVYNKWKGLVEQEFLKVNEQEKKKEETRRHLNLSDELASITSVASQVRSELEEEELDTARPATLVTSNAFTSINNANIDDPFETQASSSTRPNIFTQTSPRNSAQNTGMLPSDFPTAPNNGLFEERENVCYLPGMPYMPSPPTHEPLPTEASRIAVAEQQNIGTTNERLNNQEESVASKFAFAFGSKSGSKVPRFQFETPTKTKITQVEIPPIPCPADLTAFSEFNFGASTSSPLPVSEKETPSEEPKRAPLQEKVAKPINVSLSNKGVQSPYEFGSGGKTPLSPFEFEVPLKLQPSSRIKDSTAGPVVLFEVTLPEDNGSKISIDASAVKQPTKQPEESDLRSSTPIDGPQPISNTIKQIPARPTTPPPKNEESFGYANITPDSTRYTTYLPARQQYGLVTPPETPEMLMRSLNKPMGGPSYFRDVSPRKTDSPVPTVVRKPLPTLSSARADAIEEERHDVCRGCGSRTGAGMGHCRCEEAEVEVRTGWLARLRFKGVKEKVKDQLKVARRNILRRKESGSPGSTNGVVLE